MIGRTQTLPRLEHLNREKELVAELTEKKENIMIENKHRDYLRHCQETPQLLKPMLKSRPTSQDQPNFNIVETLRKTNPCRLEMKSWRTWALRYMFIKYVQLLLETR